MGAYRPSKGYSSNPLVNSKLRNFKCPCGSGNKVKKCCGRVIYIPSDLVTPIETWAENVTRCLIDESPASLRALMAEYAAKNQSNLIINESNYTAPAETVAKITVETANDSEKN